MNDTRLTVVGAYESKSDADFAASILQTHDIQAFVQGEMGGEMGASGETSGFNVVVSSDLADAARKLLAGTYPAEEVTHESRPGRRSRADTHLSLVPMFLLGVLAGAIVAVVLVAARRPQRSHYSGTIFKAGATAKDPGRWYRYVDGDLVEMDLDRNLDGAPDEWIFYKDGHYARLEYDENFDGKPDMWVTFEHDLPAQSKVDKDFNGVPDVTITFVHGVVTKEEWAPNGAAHVTRVVYFENGVRTKAFEAPEGSTALTREIDYGPFGNRTRVIDR